MGKLLFLILAAIAVYVVLGSIARASAAKQGIRTETPDPQSESPAELMVSCAVCGVNIPKSESLRHGNRFFCCEEHRLEGGD